MKKVVIALLLLLISALSYYVYQETRPTYWKSMEFYNASDRFIYVASFSGIDMFPKGGGPQNLGVGNLPVGIQASIQTMAICYVHLPIEVSYSSSRYSSDHISQEITEIDGLIDTTIEQEGSFLIVFVNDKFHVMFRYGDSLVHESELIDFASRITAAESK